MPGREHPIIDAAARGAPRQRAVRPSARCSTIGRALLAASMAAHALLVLGGCEVNSYLDPSRTGGFNPTASTMPVLTRIDPIEPDIVGWSNAAPPTQEDLIPNDIQYRLAPGDLLRIEIYELLSSGEMSVTVRQVDQGGNIRLPSLGEIPAAGRTLQQLQEDIEQRMRGLIPKPNVSVALDDERSLQFTVLGRLSGAGSFRLTRPDLRLLEALAITGGVPETTATVFIVRRVALSESVSSSWEQRGDGGPNRAPTTDPTQPVDIEELIRRLDQPDGSTRPVGPPPAPGSGTIPPPPTTPTPGATPNQAPSPAPGGPPVNLAALRQDSAPPIDIDELATPATGPRPAAPPVAAPRSPTTRGASSALPSTPADQFTFDRERNAWVRTAGVATATASAAGTGDPTRAGSDLLGADGSAPLVPLFAERIIAIDYSRLIRGDSSLNVVIRPNDVVYVQPHDGGFVYIDGEINRAGSYELPVTGGLTLSRLVAAAGGLNSVAIPDRVEVTRSIGPEREATVRVSLAAIRRRTEPDFLVKPNDHIIIGTNFWAVPLAVVRNGFRATYGFGFLLDRNFGNDVFGAPPENFNN